MEELFIADGFTQTKTIAAISGLHPELVIVFRPALDRAKYDFRMKERSQDPAVIDNHITEVAQKYVVSINGVEIPKEKDRVARLKPAIRAYLMDLILGYTPVDEAKDAKN